MEDSAPVIVEPLPPVNPNPLPILEKTPIKESIELEKPSSKIETPKRDLKQPIQVMQRNGRLITLPPIEAPTTRSKRLQAAAAAAGTTPESNPRTPKVEKPEPVTPTVENERPYVHSFGKI